jgi:hypothetical protein
MILPPKVEKMEMLAAENNSLDPEKLLARKAGALRGQNLYWEKKVSKTASCWIVKVLPLQSVSRMYLDLVRANLMIDFKSS